MAPSTSKKMGFRSALLSGLAAVAVALNDSDASAAGPTWNHADYETSPPVYPSPYTTGLSWEAAFEKASAFVSQLTLEEKTALVTGTAGPCTGNITPIPRLNFTGLCLEDGPLAIRLATFASVFPSGLTVAASWDRDLARRRGYELALEFRDKGSHIALGPVAGPLGRSGYGGRNWEGFSPDPFLTGELFATTIEGMQETGVQAVAKHYIGNEQETQRNPSFVDNGPPSNITFFGSNASSRYELTTIEALSSNIDDRTLHELYLWPFQNAVRSGVSSVMCSYNRINGSYACQNSKLLNGILKEELGFQGYVMSDWMAVHAGIATAEAGLDMNMPGGIAFLEPKPTLWGDNLTTSVTNGSLAEDKVTDMARRIMTPYFHLKQDEGFPAIDPTSGALTFFTPDSYLYNFTYGEPNVEVRTEEHAQSIREIGAAGTVLLKNVNNTLPLKSLKNIGVFGNDAADLTNGLYEQKSPATNAFGYEYGVLPVGGGSGTGKLTYVVSPLEAIKAKAGKKVLVQYVLNNTLIAEDNGFNVIFPQPEVCLVFLKTWAAEGYDRSSLSVDWNGDGVVEAVADNCANTIVVTHSGGLNVLPWADHPNVTAILAAHYSGQEVGNSIVDVLWGEINPSGRLPYTIAKTADDYSFAPFTNSTELKQTTDPNAWQSDFEERLLIDYRHFDYFNESVEFEFGFGLSYTTFSLDDISVSRVASSSISALPPANAIVPGGNPSLWDILYTVTVVVSNTGSIAGAAVPQLYLGLPQPANEDITPVKILRGFEKTPLKAGESKEVTFELTRRDISHWDIFTQQWTIAEGAVKVLAGFSSRDIKATAAFTPLSSEY